MGKVPEPSIVNYQYFQTVAVVVTVGPAKRVRRIWFESDVVYDDRPERPGWQGRPQTSDGRRPRLASYLKLSDIEVYLGTQDQPVSPTLEALLGTADCPAYRGRVLIVFKDLPIHKFGRIPSMSFEVESADADADGKSDLAFIVNDVMDLAGNPNDGTPGIPDENRDLTALEGIKVDGFVLGQSGEARQHLAGLQSAYRFDFVEVDYKLTAVLRGGDPVGTVDNLHRGCGTPDPQPTARELTRGQDIETPRRIEVVYQSKALDYQNFAQSTSREAALARRSDTITLPVVMSENEAMKTARIELAMRRLQKTTAGEYLPFDYVAWLPSDVILVPNSRGGTDRWKITKQLVGLFGHIEYQLVPDDPAIYTLTGEGAEPPNNQGSVIEAYAPVLFVADLNALTTADDSSFDGCSLITVVGSARVGWPGATVQSQPGIKDMGGYLQHVPTRNVIKGTIGALSESLAAYRGPNVWDTTSVLTVELAHVYVGLGEPAGGNVGDGTIEMADPSTASGVMPGPYLVEMTGGNDFTVYDPDGNTVGAGMEGHDFANQICFEVKSGDVEFEAGDSFTVTVSSVGQVGTPPTGGTDLDILNGANALVCGGEIIQYVEVNDLGGGIYELSRLLRGRRGTEHLAWAGHSAGTAVAFLNDASAVRFKAHLSEVGNTRELHAFDNGRSGLSYSNTPAASVTFAGNARKPWGPGAVTFERPATDVLIDWEYRSRWGDELQNDGGTGIARMGELLEKYDLEIWDSTFTTLKRTVSGLLVSSWTYTAAMQASDFGAAPASPFGLVLYQVSSLVGRGHPTRTVVAV